MHLLSIAIVVFTSHCLVVSTEAVSMAIRPPEELDILEKERREAHRCTETLEALYYTCAATQTAIEYLMRPNNPTGLDFKSIVAQMQNWKDVIDTQMKLVRILYTSMQTGLKPLLDLEHCDDPDLITEVNRLKKLLLNYCKELRKLIKEAASTCRGFHVACKLVLDFLVEEYCESVE